MRRQTICLVVRLAGVAWGALASCGDSGSRGADPAAHETPDAVRAREVARRDTVLGLPGAYVGTAESTEYSDTPCRIAGSEFRIDIALVDREACAKVVVAGKEFECALRGQVQIAQDAAVELVGRVSDVSGASSGLTIYLSEQDDDALPGSFSLEIQGVPPTESIVGEAADLRFALDEECALLIEQEL